MTNLTEQWEKGKLPEGDYYLDIGSDTIIDYWVCNHWNWTEYDSRIKAVLCEVPTYDEYQQLLSDQLAKNEGVEINAELEERLKKTQKLELDLRKENAQLKKWCEEFNALEVAKENTKLKDLLKEANNWLKAFYAYEQSDFVREQVKQCLTKMKQELGEE